MTCLECLSTAGSFAVASRACFACTFRDLLRSFEHHWAWNWPYVVATVSRPRVFTSSSLRLRSWLEVNVVASCHGLREEQIRGLCRWSSQISQRYSQRWQLTKSRERRINTSKLRGLECACEEWLHTNVLKYLKHVFLYIFRMITAGIISSFRLNTCQSTLTVFRFCCTASGRGITCS